MSKKITVALAGNPNSGKTTIFNMLTGARQRVGNYPGVTVEKKQGRCTYGQYDITFIDLPGTYSLTAYSVEELVARNFIIEERPNVVVDIIDSSNLERNLYLATQLMELNVPLVLAFNMSDIARQRGFVFDIRHLSTLLNAAIVRTIGNKGKGKIALLDGVIETAQEPGKTSAFEINYGQEIEDELEKIEKLVAEKQKSLTEKYPARWLATKLLERDSDITDKITSSEVLDTVRTAVAHLRDIFRDEPEIIMADRRYGFISGACQETVKTTVESRHTTSDLVDTIATHPVLGLPLFLVLMYLVFELTFTLGAYPMAALEYLFAWLGHSVSALWPAGTQTWLKSLIVNGAISGVGGVLVFLPNILLLFLAIAVLEDTGYMARAAFIMDRIMHKIGLHGKSFIPMLIGFGCSVPAIMAARILENRRNRLTTIMVIPLMSCGAKLTIYALLIPAFFPERWRAPVLWIIYLIGIVLAAVSARLLRLTLFKGETVPFVMELPPYRLPTAKAIAIHMWQRAWLFLRKAGTIILAASIIIWAATSLPRPPKKSLQGLTAEHAHRLRLEYSLVGRIGRALEPALKPLGFDWKIGTALIGATAAKEVFVSQLAIVYAAGQGKESIPVLRERLQADYRSLNAFCIMVFCLIYAPCVATLIMTRQETGSWFWAAFQFFSLTVLAYVVTLIVYQFGRLAGG